MRTVSVTFAALLLTLWIATAPIQAQSATPTIPTESALNAPVTALAIRGDHLLIGQNAQLVDAAITADNLTVSQSVDLAHGAIRAMAIADSGAAVVITEDGLIALDSHNSMTDYLPGGGYRVALHAERVYVAALAAGVRIYTLRNGKLSPVGTIATAQPAEDIAPEGTNDLWVATGSGGVQLYDLTVPNQPSLIYSGKTLLPAQVVRASGLHLLVGYGLHIGLLDTINVRTPRVIGSLTLDGSAGAQIGDALFDQNKPNDVLLGRVDVSGADMVYTTLSAAGSQGFAPITVGGQIGSDGAGERLARFGDDVFIGSERVGLRRVHITVGVLTAIMAWPITNFGACTLTDYTPSQPSPANLSAIPEAEHVTLRWQAACLAAHYQVLINGQVVATVDQPTFDYTISAGQNTIQWQVKALRGNDTGAGSVTGASWSISLDRVGYLVTPLTAPINKSPGVLYVPPPVVIDLSALQSPGGLLAESCLALLIGIGVIIGGAWLIGALAARRRG